MTQRIQMEQRVQQELASRGVTEATGVYRNHTVRIGNHSKVHLDSIKNPSMPFQGFRTITRVQRGKAGLAQSARDALSILAKPGTLDAKRLLSAFKAGQNYLHNLSKLNQLSPEQTSDTLWTFAPAVENLSNTELAAVYQSFTSGEMDLLQTALLNEKQSNPKAKDASMAAERLFDLQALVLKEVSNRASRSLVNDLIAENPNDEMLKQIALPRLTEQYGKGNSVDPKPVFSHDMTAANLLTLTEVAAESSTQREKTALQEQNRLARRDLPTISPKKIADVLRSAELTININPNVFALPTSLLENFDKPLPNIFHLADQNIYPKGETYNIKRDTAERVLFPELGGHKMVSDERPAYAALNVTRNETGLDDRKGYGSVCIVLKPEVAKRATYTGNDTFFTPMIKIDQKRRNDFYVSLDKSGLPSGFIEKLRNPETDEHKNLERLFNDYSKYTHIPANDFKWISSYNIINETSIRSEDINDLFHAYLMNIFCDKSATRQRMATYDNLESLIPYMTDFDGNALAKAAMQKINGSFPGISFLGTQYIEAQISGSIIPERDIAEIRLDLNDFFTDSEKETMEKRIRDFTKKTGIPVKTNSTTIDVSSLKDFEFNENHFDSEKVLSDQKKFLSNADEYLQKRMGKEGKGTLKITHDALQELTTSFKNKVQKNILENKRTSNSDVVYYSMHELFEESFDEKVTKKNAYFDTEQILLNHEEIEKNIDTYIKSFIEKNQKLCSGLSEELLSFKGKDLETLKTTFSSAVQKIIENRPNPQEISQLVEEAFEKVLGTQISGKKQDFFAGKITSKRDDIVKNTPAYIQDFIEKNPEVMRGIPKGTLRLDGNALTYFQRKFYETIMNNFTRIQESEDKESEVRNVFDTLLRPLITDKAALLRELETMHFGTPAQKIAFSSWICSAKALRYPEEVRFIHEQATKQAEIFYEIATAKPALSSLEVVKKIAQTLVGYEQNLEKFLKDKKIQEYGADDKAAELNRISFLALALVEHGEPALNNADLENLNTRFNSAEAVNIMHQLSNVPEEILKTISRESNSRFNMLADLLGHHSRNVADKVKAERPRIEIDQKADSVILSQGVRKSLREFVPDMVEYLNREHPL